MPEYLCCYDYGTGGIWLYLEAEDTATITARYPQLIAMERAPAWWTPELEAYTRANNPADPKWQAWLANLSKDA